MPRPTFWLKLLFFWPLTATLALASPTALYESPTTLVYPPFWHTPLGVHRGTPALLKLFLGSRTRFASPQGLACTRYLNEPASALDPDDCRVTLAGANSGLGHVLYNASMTRLEVLGDRAPLFRQPMGMALAPTGEAFVADPAWPRVVKLVWRGGAFTFGGELPPPPEGWKKPWGVCLDSANTLYVSDAGLNRIFVYSPAGVYQSCLGPRLSGTVELKKPKAVAVVDPQDTWSFYHDHYLYVLDQEGARLLRVNLQQPALPPLQKRAESLPLPREASQWAWLDLDYYEQVWVTDRLRGCVHKFDRHLNYLTSYGSRGEGDGRFDQPTGIAIYRHFGQVFVAEAMGAHYFWAGADILFPSVLRADSARPAYTLRFTLTEPARFCVSVETRDGKKSRTLCQTDWMDAGPQRLEISLPADWTPPLIFKFSAEATYSSATYFVRKLEIIWDGKTVTADSPR
jgi:hypothetical protein